MKQKNINKKRCRRFGAGLLSALLAVSLLGGVTAMAEVLRKKE